MTTAYQGTMTKAETLAQLRAHRDADEIVQGVYWENGKGCAVGCLTHDPSGGHETYPRLWGIPEQLAYLEDELFEWLRPEEAKDWPLRFMSAIPVGADLSRVWGKWQAWCLRDLLPIAGENASVIEAMAVLFERETNGDKPSNQEWIDAAGAAGAAWAARGAWAERAAWAAGAAWVAWAERAAWAAGDKRAANAERAAWAAWNELRGLRGLRGRAAWTARACDALIEILEAS